MIRCKKNGFVYIGQTARRRGLAERWTRHRRELNSQQGVNQFLQSDWNLYGAEAFEFIVLEQGVDWEDENKRKERETQLIQFYRQQGYDLYNVYDSDEQRKNPSCLLTSRDRCLENQSEEYRAYISRLNTGRPNPNRTAVVADGKTFLSITEAADYYKVSRRVIREKLKNSSSGYVKATPEQVKYEEERREQEGITQLEPPVQPSYSKKSSGLPKRIQINGQIYDSISAAARALNVSVQSISKSLQKGRSGYVYLDE